jgi:hypothetical protein
MGGHVGPPIYIVLILILVLIENAGFALRRDKQVSPAFIYERRVAPFV